MQAFLLNGRSCLVWAVTRFLVQYRSVGTEWSVAYRRDRRKDQLLQENGYLVLRYLAEELARELDSVLDGTLRSLSARRKPGSMAIPITVVRGSRV
jgi:uncharacterized protein DUF559